MDTDESRPGPLARGLTVAIVGTAAALTLAQLVMIAVSWGNPAADAFYWRRAALIQALIAFEFALVGGVIAMRRSGNRIGWLLLIAGLSYCAYSFVGEYALRGAVTAPGSLPAAGVAALLSQTIWPVPFALLAVMLLLYPTGRPLSPRWWLAAVPALVGMAIITIYATAILWPLRGDGRSLLLIEEVFPAGEPAVIVFGTILLLGSVLPAVVAVVIRWRRATGIERLQLRWLLPAGALLILGTLLNGLVANGSTAGEVALLAGLFALPASIAVAVLRYRLYEIDRVISRAISYALLTGMLGALYAAVVVVPSLVLGFDADVPNVLIAVATLVCAAVFVPLRRSLQSAVDRRFNRARYDAAMVIDEFKADTRSSVELDTVVRDLRRAVALTVEPTTTSVWIRGDR